MIDLIEEKLDLFISEGSNIEIVERIDIETNVKDIAIRIGGEEHSFTQFMHQIRIVFVEMKEKNDKLVTSWNNLSDKFDRYKKEKKEPSAGDVAQAMDLSNIK